MSLTPATEAKAAAIRSALSGTHGRDLPALLAMLTSANKDERENAKRQVRELVAIGSLIIKDEQNAADLASFANRHEPGEIGDTTEENEYSLCCHCATIFEEGTELPPGHTYCPSCTGCACTTIHGTTIEDAMKKRQQRMPGHRYKIYKLKKP